MKITVYNVKGSAGKTPISVNIALDHGYALGTNEPYHVLDSFIPDNLLLSVLPDECFPEIPDNIDIVFDLAGSISKTSKSITSALSQSDLVIVPIYNEVKCLQAGVHSIIEVSKFCKNIVVVATKLKKQRGEVFTNWNDSRDFKNIKRVVQGSIEDYIDNELEMLPLKLSTAFDSIFENEKSIKNMMEENKLLNHSYKEVQKQVDQLYRVIKNYA